MKKISVSFSYTANLGNFESCKVEVRSERNLKPGEVFEDAMEEEFKQVYEATMEKINEIK